MAEVEGRPQVGVPADILIAEDSPVQAESLRSLLVSQGHRVRVAQDGRQALEMARRAAPDLIVSDVMMPELDGYQLCRAVKAEPALAAAPFMLVTSMGSPGDVVRGLECGADSFITKPYDEAFLLARVGYLLANRALRAASVVRSGIEIELEGRRHFITAERQQILDLLIASYAAAVKFSDELVAREHELRQSHELLEQRVAERTVQLRAEIAGREAAQAALAAALARLDRAVRGSSAGIWEWQIEDGQVYRSPRYMTALGHPEAETIVRGALFADEVHPEDRERLEAALRAHLDERAPFNLELRLRTREGQYLWFSANGEAARDASGRATLMAGSIVDVTRRRRAEEELRQAQKMEAIGNLTGGVAHDFNNLLAVIVGNLDLLADHLEAGSEATELADTAMAAAMSGVELTRSLLAFARRQPLKPSRIDLNHAVQAATRLVRRALGSGIEIALELEPDPWDVFADAGQVETAVVNLLINSRDAMPEGGRIVIASRNVVLDSHYAEANPEVAPGEYASLSVTDSGLGMTPEVMARVFEPFFTTKPPGKGTGLGLAMVFGFVRQSGGHVRICSEVGRGTTVQLFLPRGAAGTPAATPAVVPGASPAARPRETILVVEDVAKVRGAARQQLERAGYRVLEAETAARALEILHAEGPIDLVFTDVVMPGVISGADLAGIVRERWPATAVLLTSGFPRGLLRDGHQLPPGVAMIDKPYRMEDLLKRLRAALDARQAGPAAAGLA